MKPIKFAKFLVLALAVTVAASGCKKTPVKVTEIPGNGIHGGSSKSHAGDTAIDNVPPARPVDENVGPTRNTAGPGTFGTGGTPGSGVPIGGTGTTGDKPKTEEVLPVAPRAGFDGMPEDATILEKQSVYFDYDSSAVKASEKQKSGPVADYLKANPNHKIRIYGNCDERGTEEYNRSLGERRALALRTELLGLGVDSERIDTVTNGKDKPKALGHDEASWRENRRGDFVVLLPPAAP